MKTVTMVIAAVSIIAPSMAMAQRHATPGTAERHATNLAESASDQVAEAVTKAKTESHRQMAERGQSVPIVNDDTAATDRTPAGAANSPN